MGSPFLGPIPLGMMMILVSMVLGALAGYAARKSFLPDPLGYIQDCTREANHDGPCNGWACESALAKSVDTAGENPQ